MDMMKRGISGTFWPVHFKPLEDELLSSWLARLAIAHGLELNSFFSIALSRKLNVLKVTDIDETEDSDLLKLLARRTGTPLDKVISTTLVTYKSWLHNDFCANAKGLQISKVPWFMPIHLLKRVEYRRLGLQFCPRCLLEDKVLYFRRRWRLAFVVFCEEHHLLLLDRCTKCSEPINFQTGIMEFEQKLIRGYTTICYSCEADLQTAVTDQAQYPADKDEVEFQKFLLGVMRQGWAEIPQSGHVYSHLFFMVLHKLITVLAFSLIAGKLRNAVSRYYGYPISTISLPKYPHLEMFNTTDRRGLVGMARRLLQDWPDGFIAFGKFYHLSQYHEVFLESEDFDSVPFWFWKVIHDHLTEFDYQQSYEEYMSELRYKFKDILNV